MGGASAVVTKPAGYLGYAPVDCDVHCTVPNTTALLPYFDEYWRDAITQRGIDRLSLNLTSYPPNAPIAARPDWRPKGKTPGGDLELLKSQALDAFGSRYAILNCLHAAQVFQRGHVGGVLHRRE